MHRATTLAGDTVVVKVRRPGIERTVDDDISLPSRLAARIADRVPDIARHDPVGVLEELGRNLREELDFDRETSSLARMRDSVGATARVPRAYPALSSRSVLTMEWIDGRKLSEARDPRARRVAASRIVASFATQYLSTGVFHADPHAGNVMITADGHIALLDLGSIGILDNDLRKARIRLSAAALQRDGRRMARAVAMVHAPDALDEYASVAIATAAVLVFA